MSMGVDKKINDFPSPMNISGVAPGLGSCISRHGVFLGKTLQCLSAS